MDLVNLQVRSLLAIHYHEDPLPVRYYLLEPIRQYARELLESSGEAALLRSRLLNWCVELGEQAEGHLIGLDQSKWMKILHSETDLFRSALRWAITSHQIDAGMRLAKSLWRYWLIQGHWREGRSWCEELLAHRQDPGAPAASGEIVSAELKTRLLYCTGALAFRQNDWKSAMAYGEQSLALAQSVNNLAEQSRALNLIALTMGQQANYVQALNYMEQALEINQRLEDDYGVSTLLKNIGSIYHENLCDFSRAEQYYRESLAIAQRLGDKGLTETYNLGSIASAQGHYEEARSYLDQSLRTAIQEGDTVIRTMSLAELGDIALQEGQYQQAENILQECYQLRRENGERLKAAYTLRQLGLVASELGKETEARQKIEQSLTEAQELQDAWGIGAGFLALANLDNKHQRYKAAADHALQGYEWYQKANSRLGQVEAIQALAQASAYQDKIEASAQWLGLVEREREEMNTPVPPNDRPRLYLVLNHLESRLGSQRLKSIPERRQEDKAGPGSPGRIGRWSSPIARICSGRSSITRMVTNLCVR